MILVYFESKVHCEHVASFNDEATFQACLPALETLAKKSGMTVTESIWE